jgi:hypothetical protein
MRISRLVQDAPCYMTVCIYVSVCLSMKRSSDDRGSSTLTCPQATMIASPLPYMQPLAPPHAVMNHGHPVRRIRYIRRGT